jgi:hypothetical protein
MKGKRETVSIIAVLVLAIVGYQSLHQGAFSLSDVGAALAATLITIMLGCLWWGWKDRIERFFRSGTPPVDPVNVINRPITPPVPILTLAPLTHYKGCPRPKEAELVEMANTMTKVDFPIPENSTSEMRFLAESQMTYVIYIGANVTQRTTEMDELIIKFGVIRVHCARGDALDCRVKARARVTERLGKQIDVGWTDIGYISWFSLAKKRELVQHVATNPEDLKRLKFNSFEINAYYVNTTENIYSNDERDLLLFYMIKDDPFAQVFTCTDIGDPISLTFNQQIKFEIELSITARNYPKNIFRYYVTAKWDDYQIQPI